MPKEQKQPLSYLVFKSGPYLSIASMMLDDLTLQVTKVALHRDSDRASRGAQGADRDECIRGRKEAHVASKLVGMELRPP